MSSTGPAGERSQSEWERIQQVFGDAIERPPEEREAFLAASVGDAPDLLREVESLLNAFSDADTFLGVPGVEAMLPLMERPEAPPRLDPDSGPGLGGTTLGPYRLGREIGRGGMGTVYLAERADARYERTVAIKVVRTQPATDLERRFSKEQRILASLEHPGIARLYDAGTTAEGTPYLVMEYVAGERLDRWCDDRAVSLEARLDLFDQVCAAVEFAHARLVVHRDLKPSNILVTEEGRAKLLDFGVARLLEAESEGTDPDPTTGLLAMTPEYASPEQLRGDPVSTSTDIWALGVLFYRLLTGRHPYDFGSRSPLEVRQTLESERAPRPSEAGASGPASARELRGDLDNIVLMALRLEPERRYGSVAELRADLNAYRTGFPVRARPDTWRYRATKFLHRNRVGVAASGLVGLAVVGGLAGVAWQGRIAAREAERAEATRDYLVGMFEALDPDELQGRSLTVEELLDLGVARLEGEATLPADERSELSVILGQMFRRLGLYERAYPLLAAAHADFTARHGNGHASTAQASAALAALLFDQGDYDDAERYAREALAARRSALGERHPATGDALSSLAGIRSTLADFDEAEALQAEALGIHRDAGARDAVAQDLRNLAGIHRQRGNLEEALELYDESLALLRDVHGDRHTEVALALVNLGDNLWAAGRYDEAIGRLEEALSIRRERFGDDHPQVAVALNNLGNVYQAKDDLDASDAAHQEALEIRRRVFGDGHPEVAGTLNNLGVNAYFRADYEDAASRFREVVEIWTEQLGEDHPDVLTVMNNLGAALREAGRLDDAEPVLRQVLDIRIRTRGPDHQDVGQSLSNLAALFHAQERWQDAERTHREALEVWTRSLGPEHPTLAFALLGLGRALNAQDRYAEAEPPLGRAVQIREANLDPNGTDLAIVRYELALAKIGLGKRDEARPLLEAALPPVLEAWGADDWLVTDVREALEGLGG